MTPEPRDDSLTTAAPLGRTRPRGRPWSPPAPTLLAASEPSDEPDDPPAPEPARRFLFVDNRYGTPIHVFLEVDPSGEPGFPGNRVRLVMLEWPAGAPGLELPAGVAIGRNPHQLDRYRAFDSDRAVAGAQFILIEPRYVGPNWPAYVLAFRPGGEKPGKSPGAHHQTGNGRR